MTTRRLADVDGFGRFWTAATLSDLGGYVTVVALPVLVVVTLAGSATDVGVVTAARWLPYLLFGLVVGILVDRVRRRPVLVATDLVRAALLVAVPLLWVAGRLSVGSLVTVMLVFGLVSLISDAAHQSFVPRLVPRALLGAANTRLEQSGAAAQTVGPVIGGALIDAVGAPYALMVDAVSYALSGGLTATLRVPEPVVERRSRRSLRRELGEGLAWVYRHPRLAPLAITTHVWFLFFSVLTTVYAPYALRGLGLDAFALGVTLALAGVGGVLGATVSERVARRVGVTPVVAGAHGLEGLGFLVVAAGALAGAGSPATVVVLATGQLLVGLGLGLSGPIEMAYRQGITPDALQGRTNATMRSVNRAAVVVGAPLGGLLADRGGFGPALAVGIAGLLGCGIALARSGLRGARL